MTLLEVLSDLPKSQRDVIIESLSEKAIQEIAVNLGNPLTGAAIGAGVGALGSLGTWGVKRLVLRNKWKKCEKLPHGQITKCKEAVEAEIKALKQKALKYGVMATAAGAGLGAAGSYQEGRRKGAADQAEQYKKEREVAVAQSKEDRAAREEANRTVKQLDSILYNSTNERHNLLKRVSTLNKEVGRLRSSATAGDQKPPQKTQEQIEDEMQALRIKDNNIQALQARLNATRFLYKEKSITAEEFIRRSSEIKSELNKLGVIVAD